MNVNKQVFKLDRNGNCTNFSLKQLKNEIKKRKEKKQYVIYVMRSDEKIIYVGESAAGDLRTKRGLKFGYATTSAYKWRKDKSLINGTIEYRQFNLGSAYSKAGKRQAIEADVAYEIKMLIGNWPQHLHGLHPHASLSANVKPKKEEIIRTLKQDKWI